MKIQLFFAFLTLLIIGGLTGCLGATKSPSVLDNIRTSLDQDDVPGAQVSQDGNEGVLTLGGYASSDSDQSQAESNAKSIGSREAVSNQVSVIPPRGELETLPVGAKEQASWVRWVIPLPKHIKIAEKIVVNRSDVQIRLRDGASLLESHAADIIQNLINPGGNEAVPRSGAVFEIVVGICDQQGRVQGMAVPGVHELWKMPNREQAYVIRPIGQNRIVLTALDEAGVYYSAQTLAQLIQNYISGGKVAIPLASISDWPDLSERGEWGAMVPSDVALFAKLKLNLVEEIASLAFDKDGKGVASVNPDVVREAKSVGVKMVPIIMHLDYLKDAIKGPGIEELYPDLLGVDRSARAPVFAPPVPLCFSKQKTKDILAEWVTSLAKQGFPTVNVWLGEENDQCSDQHQPEAETADQPQHVLEALAAARAGRIAQQFNPKFQLRILLTQGTYQDNDKILRGLSPDVGVEFYCGMGCPYATYNASRDQMIYPLLASYVAHGGWLGVYPTLSTFPEALPWSAPQFVNFRMTEYVDKGLKSVCVFKTMPDYNRIYDFNIAAMAEWAWNAHGRTPFEFAAAWATRQGLKDPDSVAKWAVLLGPVGWDLYGAGQSVTSFTSLLLSTAEGVAAGMKPKLGMGLWRYFPTVRHIDHALAVCREALAIAERLGSPALIEETRIVQGYIEMVSEMYFIGGIQVGGNTAESQTRSLLRQHMDHLASSGQQVITASDNWNRNVMAVPNLANARGRQLHNTEEAVFAISRTLAPLGAGRVWNLPMYVGGGGPPLP